MRIRHILVFLPALLAGLPCSAATHDGKLVAELQASHNVNDCFYFRLEGVSEADPVKSGDPWFAVRRDQPGAKEAYALLLAARVSATPVKVVTTGVIVCGFASASFVFM